LFEKKYSACASFLLFQSIREIFTEKMLDKEKRKSNVSSAF
jgi:hypothetical protein